MEGLEGLKGLTAQDRQNWEKEYSTKIKGLTPDQTERMYRNIKFKEKFGNRPDYDIIKNYTPEQRDSLYNGDLFKTQEVKHTDEEQVKAIGKAFEQGQQFQEEATKLDSIYNQWSARGRKAIDEFDKIANDVSPYYKKYKNTEYLPFSDEEKYKIAAEYNAAKAAYGEQEANNILRRKMQNTASKNQSVFEKFWNGFKGMGAQTAGALIGTAGMVKGAIDYVGDERNEDIDNAFFDFMDHVIDNSWTRYGNDVMQYGSLFDANIQEAKQEGGLSSIPVIRTQAEEQGTILDNLLSVNTVPELINQQGFTIASMLTGAGLSSISSKAFQGAKNLTMAANRAGALTNLNKVNTVLKSLQQAQQKTNAFVIPAMVGTVEGVSEGLNTKIQFLDEAKQMIAETQAKTVNDEFNKRLQNPEELSKQGYNPQDAKSIEKLYKDIYDSYAPGYSEAVKKAEVNAAKAGVYNMGLNSMINGALNMTLKAGLQTPSVQEAMRRSRLGRLFTPQDFRVEAGRVVPSYGKIGKVLNVLQEPAGEFTEEYLQSVSDAFARGGAEYNLQNFITNKYKGDGKEVVDESLANDFFAASRATGDAMVDKETILAGIYGALASGMGTPTINNRRGPAVRREDESKLSYAMRRSPITYRNPIWEAIQEQKEASEERSTAASIMTDWIQDPANKSKYDGLVGTFNWAKSMEEASGKNDEFDYRNSELGKTINDVMTLEKLRGTDYYNSFMQDLTRTANLEEGSDEANSMIEQFKNMPNNRDIEQDDSQILSTIKKNSNKLLNTMSSIATESKSIDKMLGNAADEDTKQALIYGKLSVDSWRERATQLEEEISSISINPTTSSNLSDTQRDLLINYGSLGKAHSEYQKLREKIGELETDIANINSRKNLGVKETETLRAKRVALKTLEKQAKVIAKVEETIEGNPILSEADIMQLNPTDRATILNPENKNKYSEEQQSIIDNVVREGTLQYNDFMDKVQDAGRINLAQQAYLTQYNSILSDPASFNAFTNRIKQQVANDNTKKKYEFLNEVQDYATFVKGLDKAYRESDARERQVIRNILSENENYKKYLEDNKNLDGMFDQLDSNDKFKELDENDRNVIMTTMQFLVDRGVSPTDATALTTLTAQDENGTPALLNYIDEVNGRLPSDMQLTPVSIEEIIQTYNDIIGEHTKNINEVEVVNKPVEVAPTTTEASKPPVQVGIFGQIQQNPEMAADKNLKEETSTSTKPGVFGDIQNNPDLARGVDTESTTETPTTDLVDKYKVNSNEEVANSVQTGLSIIANSSSIYDEVKEQATQIIDELGDSEYETPTDLSETIMTKANQIQAQVEAGGDRNDKVSSLLKQVAAKMKVKSEAPTTKVKKVETPSTVNEERRNNSMITTADVDRHPQSVVGQASKNFKMNDYLRKGHITPKTPIMFVADPAIVAGVKQEMGEAYNEEDHLPIMAIVEDSNGPIIIGDKKYQPIGFMPRTSANSQGAARMESVRLASLTQQDGTLLKSKDGKVITTNGYVRANPPEHTKAGTPNTLIHTIMSNDMDAESRAKMNDVNLPIQERQSIYRKFKNSILPNIRRVAQDAKGERIHLAYFTPNMKGGEQEFELYVTTPQNSISREGKPIAQVLIEGTPEEIIKANSRLHRYGKVLEEFFKKKPFSDDTRFKRENGVLVPVGESASKLQTLSESLTKKLSNYITIPKGYEYVLTPTEEMLEDNRMYQLALTNGASTIPLANVTNGTMTDETKAQAIKNLFIDGGNFRYEGTQPFAKWQVNYNDFGAKEGESEDARKARLSNASDIFDDNILESSRTSLKYTIRGIDINSPFKQDGSRTPSPTPVVANQVNATTSKPIDTPVITATDQVKVGNAIVDSESGAILQGEVKPVSNPAVDKARDIANRIVEDSKSIRLADDNSGYVDEEGRKYARVTSIIQADELAGERFDPNSPWITPSTNIGTSVDEFVRDFFAGKLDNITTSPIATQLWNHLQNIGLSVSGSGEMQKFLRTHNLQLVQQATESPEVQKEMDEIKKEAIANGTFMKAPNGKPSNLTEKQYAQIRTKAFKRWFGDWENDSENASKVVDENGEPLVVYHGSKSKISKFDISFFGKTDGGNSGIGFYFTPEERYAKTYGENVHPAFLNIKTSLITEGDVNIEGLLFNSTVEQLKERFNEQLREYKQEFSEKEFIEAQTQIDKLLKQITPDIISRVNNSDGVINKSKGKIFEIVVKNPNQIKSATDNIGTFSRTNNDITTFITSQGEVYGFVDKDGNIYLDENKISPEHPIHEYTHLWDRIIQQKNPKLWNRGVELMKQTTLWNEILNSEHYGKTWQQLGISEERLDNLIASEVHSRLTGTEGEALLKKLANKKGQSNIISKLKDWLLDTWKTLGETFGVWNKEDLDNLTLENFNHLTIRDFAKGYNPVNNTFKDTVSNNAITELSEKYPNATEEALQKFREQLMSLRNNFISNGLTVIPRDVTVTGTVKVTDTQGQVHEVPVAGTLDLLAYDAQGNFHIFDMKTNRSGINDEKRKKYAKQVSVYQKFIEDKYGIKVASLNIIPINVTYPAPLGFRDGKTKYEVSEGNQLLANGKEYKDSKPILEEVGLVPYTDVNIQYDKLTDSEKQMITDMLPAGVEVEKTEIVEPETVVNKNLGLKMGRVKNRFAKPAKKGNLVTPSANNWESISDDVRQAAIQLGYTKESWNNMTEEEKQHQKECLS